MGRRHDWPERLAGAIAEAETRTFSEVYYCAVFAADCVLAMTDEDPLSERHETLGEAYSALLREHVSILAALEAKFGPPIPLSFAQRGDVIYRVDELDNVAIGICCGQHSAFISAQGGLAHLPTLEQRAAFAVR